MPLCGALLVPLTDQSLTYPHTTEHCATQGHCLHLPHEHPKKTLAQLREEKTQRELELLRGRELVEDVAAAHGRL